MTKPKLETVTSDLYLKRSFFYNTLPTPAPNIQNSLQAALISHFFKLISIPICIHLFIKYLLSAFLYFK